MWMLPLYLHVNQNSDYDMMVINTTYKNILNTHILKRLLALSKTVERLYKFIQVHVEAALDKTVKA